MNLASVQKIIKLTPILGADLIETATVLGWEIVVKKGEFKENDLCCYVQIDTVMPDLPEYEFLRERKFRVRTIKLRKQISQGLIIPLPKGNWKEEFEKRKDPMGKTYYWLTGFYNNHEPDAEDTDEWALRNNYVSVVPVTVDMTAHGYIGILKKRLAK